MLYKVDSCGTCESCVQASIKNGDKVGVAGISDLGHFAIKLAVAKGAEGHAFITSASKVNDIRRFGAKEIMVVGSLEKRKPYNKSLDYMISTLSIILRARHPGDSPRSNIASGKLESSMKIKESVHNRRSKDRLTTI
jgi:hypothetical protein